MPNELKRRFEVRLTLVHEDKSNYTALRKVRVSCRYSTLKLPEASTPAGGRYRAIIGFGALLGAPQRCLAHGVAT